MAVHVPITQSWRDQVVEINSEMKEAPKASLMKGTKYDQEKSRYDLIPPVALEEFVRVLTFGAKKYAPDNWRKVPDGRRRYFAAAQRHIWAYKRGEKIDEESNCHHLACAITDLMFILEKELLNEPDLQENQ